VATVWAAFTAWKSARRARKAEENAAQSLARSEMLSYHAGLAADNAAAAQRQLADAVVKRNQMTVERAQIAEDVSWAIEHSSGSVHKLRNLSHSPKFGVKIDGPGVSTVRPPNVTSRIDGRSSVEFHAKTGYGVQRRVTVTWHNREDLSNNPLQWSDTLPAPT